MKKKNSEYSISFPSLSDVMISISRRPKLSWTRWHRLLGYREAAHAQEVGREETGIPVNNTRIKLVICWLGWVSGTITKLGEKKTILESYTLSNWQHLCRRSREGSEGAVTQWTITRGELWSSGGSPGGKGQREVWSSGRSSIFWMWWWIHIYTWVRVPKTSLHRNA